MARPKKAPDEQRSERLAGIRLTTAERHHIELQAERAGLDVAEFSRRAILGQRVGPARRKADDRALIELNRIGTNLNQITARLHAKGELAADVRTVLDEVRAAAERIGGDGS